MRLLAQKPQIEFVAEKKGKKKSSKYKIFRKPFAFIINSIRFVNRKLHENK